MSDAVKQALSAARRAQQTIGNTVVFPAPKNPTQSCGRHVLDGWLRKAFELTGLSRQPGGMWHSIRRKWVTERKGYPIKETWRSRAGGGLSGPYSAPTSRRTPKPYDRWCCTRRSE